MKAAPKPVQPSPEESAFIDLFIAQGMKQRAAAYEKAFGVGGDLGRMRSQRLVKLPHIAAEIKRRRTTRVENLHLDVNDLLKELRAIIVADPRELMEHRRGACRYCYGFDYGYQRTPEEYRKAVAAYRANNDAAAIKDPNAYDPLNLKFDPQGGIGFNPTKKPVKTCPECFGHGQGYSYIKDSRDVSPAAARLFAGLKETTAGVEIKTRSTDKAVQLMMQHLGMLEPDDKSKGGTAEEKAALVRSILKQAGATIGGPGK